MEARSACVATDGWRDGAIQHVHVEVRAKKDRGRERHISDCNARGSNLFCVRHIRDSIAPAGVIFFA